MTTPWVAPIASWNPTALPLAESGHPGAFGVERMHHFHEDADLYLYTQQHGPVFAVETGYVLAVVPFTGINLGHSWWNDTDAIFVHGESEIVVYGEVRARVHVRECVRPRQEIGRVARVLKKDKG